MAAEYTGADWPYEPHQAQKESVKDGEVYVLLLGERQDVDAIRDITTSYSYLVRYGRPFAPLYNLVFIRPDDHFLYTQQEAFKHQQYTLAQPRLPLLKKLIEQRPTLLYEVVYREDGEVKTERNFEYAEQGTMTSAAQEALEKLGWVPRPKSKKKAAVGGYPIHLHAACKKAIKEGKRPDVHAPDRWWNELLTFWRGRKKA